MAVHFDISQKLGLECVDKVRKRRNGQRPKVEELLSANVGGIKRTSVDSSVCNSAERRAQPQKLLCSSESDDVYTAALRATLQMEQGNVENTNDASVPAVAAPEPAGGLWGGAFARWAESPQLPAAKALPGVSGVQTHKIEQGYGVLLGVDGAVGGAGVPAQQYNAQTPALADFMPSSLRMLFLRSDAVPTAPVQHWSASSADTTHDQSLSPPILPADSQSECGSASAETPSASTAAGASGNAKAAPSDAQSSSRASMASGAPSQHGSVHGWDTGSIASRSAAAAAKQHSSGAASGITMPGWTLASTLPLPAGMSAHSLLRPREDDSMEMRAAVARCSVPCFRMTFDHQVGGLEALSAEELAGMSTTDTVMRWVKGAKPQSTFANLEASQMLGLSQADFAACGAGNGNCACATPMVLMHPGSVKNMLAQVHGMQTSMVRVLSGASSAAEVNKTAFPPKMLSPCRGSGARQLKHPPLMSCPTEMAVQNGPMVRAPPGGLAHGKAVAFTPLDCVTYVGLEWWLPPGWAPDTMRRTVQEGLTAAKVAQQWPRLRSVTCYILESKQALPSGRASPSGDSTCDGAVSVRTGSDSVLSVPVLHPVKAVSTAAGVHAAGGAETASGAAAPSVPGGEVRTMGDALLGELLQAQPGCFEGCWPASTGALAAVLTAYMKSLFVLTRAAGEAVMDL